MVMLNGNLIVRISIGRLMGNSNYYYFFLLNLEVMRTVLNQLKSPSFLFMIIVT